MLSKKIILASNSPRRQELLKHIQPKFEIVKSDFDERFPADLQPEKVASFIAEKKAESLISTLDENSILITADTIVIIKNEILGKPENKEKAKSMLKKLSGETHKVITSVCICDKTKKIVFDEQTLVTFGQLSEQDIEHYVETFNPIDKAGAYGIQEWIGMVGIEKIDGSFYNVMGFPVHKVYENLKSFA